MRFDKEGRIEAQFSSIDARSYRGDPPILADCVLLIDAAALVKALAPKAAKNKSKVSRALKGSITLRVISVRGAK